MRRNVVYRNVSRRSAIVGVRPEVLSREVRTVTNEQVKKKDVPARNIAFQPESKETLSG